MRIRLPFAGAFLFLIATAAYAGLTSLNFETFPINDKVLHLLTFFVLTTCFYWILDTSRRRSLNLTLLVCTGVLGIGSEFLQGFLPNERTFDFYDIVANIAGSLAAIALSIPGDEEHDVELGEGLGAQESGTISTAPRTLDDEVDNWDENMEDNWDEDEHGTSDDGPKTPSASSAGDAEGDPKK
ncbi:hypothetical protein G7Y89_g6816 [Cudoniella acicularis]|uniref:VanZ-like domain-containing protein n=1 Tax=Cudoniella acicularis TaxID=354080 RepID=A0A8H4RKJ4_9HELO|nr:hypothetical protein G7Y89_g6816 [Cudoniella acicularis]